MSDFGTMKTRIGSETLRSDTDSLGFIGSEILTAIAHYDDERLKFNEVRATASTTADDSYVALPSDFMDLDHLKIEVNGSTYDLVSRSFSEIEDVDSTTYTGQPTRYAVYDNQLRLYPTPDKAYELTLAYLQSLSALSADTDTNAWMTTGEELIRARAKAAFRINYLYDEAAVQEQLFYAGRDEEFLCHQEKSAYRALRRASNKYISTNKLRGSGW